MAETYKVTAIKETLAEVESGAAGSWLEGES
jgi:hypothetical protein